MPAKRRNFWTADCETDPFKRDRVPQPFIWGAFNGDDYHEFTDTKSFIDFFHEQNVVVYAHNGGKFDWHYVIPYLESFTDIMIISGRIASFKIGQAEFRDSYNIIPIPLDQYKKDDIDYKTFEADQRYKPNNWKNIRSYLKSDCVYLFELIDAFYQRFGANLTYSGAAFKTWHKMSGIKTPKTTPHFYKTFQPFYYGGRVEAIEPGIISEPYKMIDIKSAYPFAMTHHHPYGNKYIVTENLPKTDAYTQRCFIELHCRSNGALPYREKNGTLTFPRDNNIRLYYITGWEFLAGLETNSLTDIEIKRVYSFPDSIEFSDYINLFYSEKEANAKGSSGYLIPKLMLTALYGKYAANPEKYRNYIVIPTEYIEAARHEGYEFVTLTGPFALMEKELEDHERRYYNLATASSITGFVRAYLWKALSQCYRPLYCDTDSICAIDTGNIDLTGKKVGSWELEAEGNYGGIAGKKLYALLTTEGTYKTAHKGAQLTPQEILRICNGESIEWKADAPTFRITGISRDKSGSLESKTTFNKRCIKMTA